MTEEANQEKKSDTLVLAEAMNNLAAALRDSNQLVREMQLNSDRENIGLPQAINELSQRLAVLSTRLR